jgi:hypothetical protein
MFLKMGAGSKVAFGALTSLLPASLFATAVITLLAGGPSRRRLMVGRGAIVLLVVFSAPPTQTLIGILFAGG